MRLVAGLGYACALQLAREGCHIVVNARGEARLQQAAAALRSKTGATVTAMANDICTEDGRARLVAACRDADILVNNNAGPPPGQLSEWDHAARILALEAKLLAAALLMRVVLPGMRERRFGRIVNVTSAMVSRRNL